MVLYHGILGLGRSLGLIVRSAVRVTDRNLLVFIGEAACGFARDFEAPEQLGAFVNEVTREPARLRHLGQNGQQAFRERFNRERDYFLEPIRLLLREA